MSKTQMVQINVNEDELQELILEQINEKLEDFDNSKLFYTMEDLKEITGFSNSHIRNTFFDDERFAAIRRKVGRKWVFEVEATRDFLRKWLREQPNE